MDGFDFVVGLNPVVGRGKDASPNMDKYNEYDSTKRAKILKQRLDPPAVSKVTKDGNLKKLDRGDGRLDYRPVRRGARSAHCGPLRTHLRRELLLA